MKKFLLFILPCCLYLSVSAQKVYFIYFESDNHPFYLKMADKVYSSSAPGYLLLSSLKDSTYTFFIGFPAGQTKEARFRVSIKGADRGFAIKNIEGELNLFDLQNLNLIKPVQDQVATTIRYETRSDEFSSLLSKAAGDSSLLFAPVLAKVDAKVKEEKKEKAVTSTAEMKSTSVGPTAETQEVKLKSEDIKPQTDVVVAHADTVGMKSDSIGITASQSPPPLVSAKQEKEQNFEKSQSQNRIVDSTTNAQSIEEYRKTVVRRHSESSTSEGFGLVFFDTDGERVDTIRLTIPNPRMVIADRDTVQDDKAFLEIKEVKKDLVQQPSQPSATANQSVAPVQSLKSQCGKLATDNDFFKLRKNMAIRKTDEAMVDEAKKYFKSKCFTTEQIKNLGTLFLTSAGKYQFFDAAYLHVSDREQFASLQSEIKDAYYLRRFKALLGE